MDLEKIIDRLFESARHQPVSERVPYAFEKRIMARLKVEKAVDPLTFWSRALWKAVAPCMAAACLVAGIASFSGPKAPPGNLSLSFENSVIYSGSFFSEVW